MFLIMIPVLPSFADFSLTFPTVLAGIDFMLLARSTSVPQKTSEMRIVKTFNGRFTVPYRTEMTHEWSVKLLMTEDAQTFNVITNWYNASQMKADGYTADAFIVMLDYNYNPTKIIQMKNVYPLEVPAIHDLNQDGTEDMMDIDVKFSFDDMNFNEDGVLDWLLKIVNPTMIMNILKVNA